MTFKEYQKLAREYALYPTLGSGVVFPTLGMVGEAGEVAEKVKKLFRDQEAVVTDATREEIQKELGDVLWYMSQIASELNIDLEQVALKNLEKIESREKRGLINGSGDNR